MTALKLIPGNENRVGGFWSATDFNVVLVDSGETVGRIYARTGAAWAVRIGGGDWPSLTH